MSEATTATEVAASTIPVIVCAKNEARSLGATLRALDEARRFAEERTPFRYVVRVVLDDTTDDSADIVARHPNVELLTSRGGKVEAQRVGLRQCVGDRAAKPAFAIFCDADVRPSRDSLHALSSLLDARPDVQVATCRLQPLPPRRKTLIARAIHTYNSRRGFSSQRTWFNGKLFAIRAWHVPDRASLAPRIAALPADPFYDFSAGLVIDDVFLSRAVAKEHGPNAIAETLDGVVEFRAPETLRGMNRYYRRLRREIERLDILFPETAAVHVRHGTRTPDLLDRAPFRQRLHYACFTAALGVCRVGYVTERAWIRRVRRRPRDVWQPIEETKQW